METNTINEISTVFAQWIKDSTFTTLMDHDIDPGIAYNASISSEFTPLSGEGFIY